MSISKKELGRRGEEAALLHFQKLGYHLLEKNHRRGRGAEADLILQDGDTLVFCEVKTRGGQGSGHAVESYSGRQQARLRRLILAYIQRHNWGGPLRVDLLALQARPEGLFEIHHVQNALDLDDNW